MSTLCGYTIAETGKLCYNMQEIYICHSDGERKTMNALERFLRYAVVHTASDRLNYRVTPSTECQHILCEMLEKEMKEMGMENVTRTEHAYVYGFVPATPGYESCKCIGFNAHLDIVADLGIGVGG